MMTNESGVIVTQNNRHINYYDMDLCEECFAWNQRNNGAGIIPIKAYLISGSEAPKFEFSDNGYVATEQDTDVLEELGLTLRNVSSRYISRDKARKLPMLWKELQNKGISSIYTIKDVVGDTVATLSVGNDGASKLYPHINGKKATASRILEQSVGFNDIQNDETSVKFYMNSTVIYEILTNLRV